MKKMRSVFEKVRKIISIFQRHEKITSFFKGMKNRQVFQNYEKMRSVFEKVRKIISIGRTNTSPSLECERRRFTND